LFFEDANLQSIIVKSSFYGLKTMIFYALNVDNCIFLLAKAIISSLKAQKSQYV